MSLRMSFTFRTTVNRTLMKRKRRRKTNRIYGANYVSLSLFFISFSFIFPLVEETEEDYKYLDDKIIDLDSDIEVTKEIITIDDSDMELEVKVNRSKKSKKRRSR